MSYRAEYKKIYNRIQKVAQKGTDGTSEFYQLIDEIIDSGQYDILQNLLYEKYKILAIRYKSIRDLKRESFPIIRRQTNSIFQTELKKLIDSKNLYQVGFYYFDKTTNKYLGDIRELEDVQDWIYYKDPKLAQKQDEIIVINLEVVSGLSSSVLDAIPPFELKPTDEKTLNVGDILTYNQDVYQCITSYTWNVTNQITPTASSYWQQILPPTYSLTIIGDDNTKLIDKYKLAFDLVKTFEYRTI